MLLCLSIPYTAHIVPPRCRNYRDTPAKVLIEVDVLEFGEAEAPLVVEVTRADPPGTIQWRSVPCPEGGRMLVRPSWTNDDRPLTFELLPAALGGIDRSISGIPCEAEATIRSLVQAKAKQFAIIDGSVWRVTSEPAVKVTKFLDRDSHSAWLSVELVPEAGSALYRLDEISAARSELARCGEVLRFTIHPEDFTIDVRRPDLLARPTHDQILAMRSMATADEYLNDGLGSLSTARERLSDATKYAHALPPADADRLRALMATLHSATACIRDHLHAIKTRESRAA